MGTLIVGIVLMAIVVAIIISQIKNKKKGKNSCGGNCAHCANHRGACSAEKADGQVNTVVEIDGMMCPMCESHVNDAIRNNFDVKSVKSFFKTGICLIVSEKSLDKEKITQVLKASGYTVKNINA
ncbi:MAG: FeoB-associated Cys-rich membrane protein [Treponema sp.]|nr:FeoB-associated Cys-rich membrane protein [Treponema sp.]